MVQNAIKELCALIPSSGSETKKWENAAQAICRFAQTVSDSVLLRAGFHRTHPHWSCNSLVLAKGENGDILNRVNSNTGMLLMLNKIRTDLAATQPVGDYEEHAFYFRIGKVVEWDSRNDRQHRVLSYEEAARFIIFWLAEKILQICRKNEWDRIKNLPNLFDLLGKFVTSDSVPLPGNQNAYLLHLMEIFEFEGPESRAQTRAYNVLRNAGAEFVFQAAQLTWDQLRKVKGCGKKTRAVIEDNLGSIGARIGMNLPADFISWCEEQASQHK